MSRIQWSERGTPAANAARVLPELMARYFAHVRDALAAKPSPANLHPIRLASKRIRYTLELFDKCYGPEFAERMQTLKDVQTSLGDVNDAVSVDKVLADSMPQSTRRKALRGYMKNRAAEKAEEFRVHWMEKFDAAGEEERWVDFLKHPRRAAATRTAHG